MTRRRTHGWGPYKPGKGPHKPIPPKPGPHKPGPSSNYEALIDKMLKAFGFKPGKHGLMLFIGCADAIAGSYKMWSPFKPGLSRKEIFAWMKKIYAICMNNKPAGMSCGDYFRAVCKKAQHAGPKPVPKPAPPRQGPIPARPRPKSPGTGPSTMPPTPEPPGKRPGRISPYVRGVRNRRRAARG